MSSSISTSTASSSSTSPSVSFTDVSGVKLRSLPTLPLDTLSTEDPIIMATVKPKRQPSPDALKSFISGGFGGMCLVLAGHPMDLIKVRIQTQTSNQYTSTVGAFRHILQKDGVRGLYRGMSTPLLGVTPMYAVCFWGYDLGQRLALATRSFRDVSTESLTTPLSLKEIMFAGGFSALPTTVIMTPMERVKVILQVQDSLHSPSSTPTMSPSGVPNPSTVRYTGPIHVIRSLLSGGGGSSGIRVLYQGTAATLLRDIPGSIAYFGTYEATKRFLTSQLSPNSSTLKSPHAPSSKDEHSEGKPFVLPVPAILLAGGLAGMANWFVAIPADVIKSRIQARTQAVGLPSGFQILTSLLRNEGPKALFKGLGPALIRAFPANAACFLGVELSLRALNIAW